MTPSILIREHPEYIPQAARWFSQKQGVPAQATLDSLTACADGGQAVPPYNCSLALTQ